MMTAEEFFQLANQSVSDNPEDRLPAGIKERLGTLEHTSDQMMFDVHAHCFTLDNVPKDFGNIGWLRDIPGGLQIAAFVIKLLSQINNWVGGKNHKYYEQFGRLRFLKNFGADKKTADSILLHQYNRYNYAFRNVLNRPQPHIFIVQLMMGMEWGITGKPKNGFYRQWEELSQLRSLRRYDQAILPFLAVDPRNPNLYEDFLAAFSAPQKRVNRTGQSFLDTSFPFFGVKIYPSLGYLPSDPVLMDIFSICAAKNIPVTTHCGGAAVRFSADQVKGAHYLSDGAGHYTLSQYTFDLGGVRRKDQSRKIADFFNAPYNWLAVVEKYPRLKLNLAHFGGSDEWLRYRQGEAHTHVHETLEMLQQYPNVYADISYAYANGQNLNQMREMLYADRFSPEQRAVFQDRFLSGSDYYMTDQEKSLVTVVANLLKAFEDDKPMLDRICVHNPLKFLLDIP